MRSEKEIRQKLEELEKRFEEDWENFQKLNFLSNNGKEEYLNHLRIIRYKINLLKWVLNEK